MDLGINGLRVMVSAGANGIGLEIARAFVREGATVHVCDVDKDGLERLRGSDPQLTWSTCDVSDRAQVARFFQEGLATLGGLDCLVNNAGTCFMSEFPAIPPGELDRQMRVNFHSAFHCAQAAVPRMQAREGVKKIVQISSNGAYNFDVFDPPHYRASPQA